jgi:hypothetical protein
LTAVLITKHILFSRPTAVEFNVQVFVPTFAYPGSPIQTWCSWIVAAYKVFGIIIIVAVRAEPRNAFQLIVAPLQIEK